MSTPKTSTSPAVEDWREEPEASPPPAAALAPEESAATTHPSPSPTPSTPSTPPTAVTPKAGLTKDRVPGKGVDGKAKQEPDPDKADEDKPSPAEERLLSGLPFLFGGGLALFFAYALRDAPARTGVPPLWILFLTLGAIALAAGILLVLSTEPEGEDEEDDGKKKDTIVVPKKEWERLQSEVTRLRASSSNAPEQKAAPSPPKGASPAKPDPSRSEPRTSEAGA